MISKYIAIIPALLSAPLMMAQHTTATAADTTASKKVHVAYRTVDSDELLGGVSVLDMEELLNKNYLNGIEGQNWEGYVSGWNGNSLWGMDADNDGGYLMLIDGVPRDANNINPSEVSQITFLKGAQAVVLYGSRAAKGAILITTKRGKEGPLQVDIRANTGWHVAKSWPEYLGSAEYMTLYNEARVNDGLAPSFDAATIYNTATGVNPYRYPDINFYSEDYVRKTYNFTDATAEISGGNQRARFYTNINYLRYDDLINFGEAKKDYTDRFSVRGNINLNLGSWVSAYVDAAVTFYNSRSGHGNYWSQASTVRPNRFAPMIPVDQINEYAAGANELLSVTNNIFNGMFLSGTSIDKTNIFADYYAKGYNKFTSRQFQFDTGVNINLEQVLKGLSFNTQFAVDYATSYNTNYTNEYAVFIPTWANINGKDIIVGLTQEGLDKRSGIQNTSDATDRQTIHFSAQFNYDRTFGYVHNVRAMALASGWQRQFAGTYHRTSNANLGFLVDYNYDKRYYLDLSLAGLHSAKFAPGHRQKWSPSATLGWRLSQENFLKDSQSVNELMLSVSASNLHTDLDISDFFMYQENFARGGWFSWASGGYNASYIELGSNYDLTYIARKELSANVRGSFFNHLLDLDASVFVIKTEGLPINTSTKYPTYFSTYYPDASLVPWVNYNNNERKGFDFGVKLNKNVGEVNLQLGVNGTYYNTKATRRDELNENEYQNREGKILDGIWGYQCEGFFTSQAEIDSWADQSPLGAAKLIPGDLKYTDQNGDGVINAQDQVLLARGGWYGSPFTMGVNFTAQWRGFTLFVLGTGYFGGNALKNDSYWWVKSNDKYSAAVRDRWTPETADTATYPRLTTTDGSNNFKPSDFWLYKTDRFNLAKIQLTYTAPSRLFHDKVVKGVSVYASGSNLVTFGPEREILEMNVGGAPQTRFYNIGAKVTF